jgi:hypothetical protein
MNYNEWTVKDVDILKLNIWEKFIAVKLAGLVLFGAMIVSIAKVVVGTVNC